MQKTIFIEPGGNRHEAILAWAGALTTSQMDEIEDAPETAIIALKVDMTARTSIITIIPEG